MNELKRTLRHYSRCIKECLVYDFDNTYPMCVGNQERLQNLLDDMESGAFISHANPDIRVTLNKGA